MQRAERLDLGQAVYNKAGRGRLTNKLREPVNVCVCVCVCVSLRLEILLSFPHTSFKSRRTTVTHTHTHTQPFPQRCHYRGSLSKSIQLKAVIAVVKPKCYRKQD